MCPPDPTIGNHWKNGTVRETTILIAKQQKIISTTEVLLLVNLYRTVIRVQYGTSTVMRLTKVVDGNVS